MKKIFIYLLLLCFFIISCDGYQAKKAITDPDRDPFASMDEDISSDSDEQNDESDISDDSNNIPDKDQPSDDDIIDIPDDFDQPDDHVIVPDENNLDEDIIDDDQYNDEDPDEEPVPCVDECFNLDSIKCSGTKIVKCAVVNSCMIWQEISNCGNSDRLCNDNNTVGNSSDSTLRSNVFRGTFIEATENAVIHSFSIDIDNTSGQPLTFAIYTSETSNGTYELIMEKTIENPGAGRKMYSSGPIELEDNSNFIAAKGRFYLFGVAWAQNMRSYYRSFGNTEPYAEETISFGKTLGGTAPQNSFPLLAEISGASKTKVTYMTQFDTGATEDDLCICNNRCAIENDFRCNSDFVEECIADTYGCRNWHVDENCKPGTCSVIEDIPQCTCEDECKKGEKRCVGNVLEECKEHENGCSYWMTEQNCSDSIVTPYCEILEITPADAQCTTIPQTKLDHIAQNSNQTNSNNTGYAKGVYVRADFDAKVTEFKFNIAAPEKTDVYFSIYEGATRTGVFNRIYRGIFEVDVENSDDLTPAYYGPEDISVDIKKGHFYLFQFWDPDGLKFHSRCGVWPPLRYPTVFGEALGHSNVEFENEPPETRELNDTGNCFYKMWIESHLR